MLFDFLGYVSGILLAFCALPQFLKIIKDGHCKGLSRSFLWMWFIGLVGVLIHTYLSNALTGALTLNFIMNIIFSGISLVYSYFPKKKDIYLSQATEEELEGLPEG